MSTQNKVSKRSLKSMSASDFFNYVINSDNDEFEDTSDNDIKEPNVKHQKLEGKQSSNTKTSDDKKKLTASMKHKASLDELRDQDPEFYKFLKDNDKALLDFDMSDDELDDSDEDSSSSELKEPIMHSTRGDQAVNAKKLNRVRTKRTNDNMDNDSEDSNEDESMYHKVPDKLEVDSDASESSDDEDNVTNFDSVNVTAAMIQKWSENLKCDVVDVNDIREVLLVFKSALHQVGGDSTSKDDDTEGSKYQLKGSNMFNNVMRVCLTDLLPAIYRYLNLQIPDSASKDEEDHDKQSQGRKQSKKEPKKQEKPEKQHQQHVCRPEKSKKWKKIKAPIKVYLIGVLRMYPLMSDVSVQSVLLRHIYRLIPFYQAYYNLNKPLIKCLSVAWSSASSDESVRVLSFLCVISMCRSASGSAMNSELISHVVKVLYTSYVSGCKFTSPNTLPVINFMRRSLVEVFTLIDPQVTYQHAFVYIRQMAIHLRNAISNKNKDSLAPVYSWQYVHCLTLWSQVISSLYKHHVTIQPLLYPLTQIITGTITLRATPTYYPLRFHCIRSLLTITQHTNTFIPVISYILDIFDITDFNKKHSSVGFKPINFATILKFSKSQLKDRHFKDGVMEHIYDVLIEYLHIYSHRASFPDITHMLLVRLKSFIKKCRIGSYCKQMKQIVDKIRENSQYLAERMERSALSLASPEAVEKWESAVCKEGATPVQEYYKRYRALRERELRMESAGTGQRMDVLHDTGERANTTAAAQRSDTGGKGMARDATRSKQREEDRKEFPDLFLDAGATAVKSEALSDSSGSVTGSGEGEDGSSGSESAEEQGKEVSHQGEVDTNVDEVPDIVEDLELLSSSDEEAETNQPDHERDSDSEGDGEHSGGGESDSEED